MYCAQPSSIAAAADKMQKQECVIQQSSHQHNTCFTFTFTSASLSILSHSCSIRRLRENSVCGCCHSRQSCHERADKALSETQLQANKQSKLFLQNSKSTAADSKHYSTWHCTTIDKTCCHWPNHLLSLYILVCRLNWLSTKTSIWMLYMAASSHHNIIFVNRLSLP